MRKSTALLAIAALVVALWIAFSGVALADAANPNGSNGADPSGTDGADPSGTDGADPSGTSGVNHTPSGWVDPVPGANCVDQPGVGPVYNFWWGCGPQ